MFDSFKSFDDGAIPGLSLRQEARTITDVSMGTGFKQVGYAPANKLNAGTADLRARLTENASGYGTKLLKLILIRKL